MKRFCFVVSALVLVAVPGCNDDPECPECPECTECTAVVVAQGTATTPPGRYFLDIEVARVSVYQPGRLVATVSDGNGSVSLISAFIHSATDPYCAYRRVEGPSPLVLAVDVTQNLVDAGHEWLFFVTRSDAGSATISYTITFTPD